MRRNSKSLRRPAAVCALLAAAAAPAFGQTRVWTLTEAQNPPLVTLAYAVPETDDSFGAFRCAPGKGVVTLALSATSARLKPGRRATAVVTLGKIRAKVPGKLTPNEEAGAPGFEGRIDARHPLVAALQNGGTLRVAVGPSTQSAPLDGQSETFRKFAATCATP
jgi:hypothetical protein